MAGNEESVTEGQESPTEAAASPERAGHGEEEPAADPLASLSPAGRDLLDVYLEVLKEFDPRAGALDDIPQVSIEKQHTMDACRLIKDDPRLRRILGAGRPTAGDA